MSVSSALPLPSDSKSTHHRPAHRKDFHIAIICALSLEYDAASLLVDEFWDEDDAQYGRTSGDTNVYRNGRIGVHNVVLILLPSMGKASVAGSAASLRNSYPNLKIAFLVGVCGGVPIVGSHEALLGDVVIGEDIIQYDFGRQYPEEFIPKEAAEASKSIPNKDIRTFLAYFKSDTGRNELRQNTGRHLKALQAAAHVKRYQHSYRYPGFDEDKLFVATYRHRHRRLSLCESCGSKTERYCDKAAQSSCAELECDESKLVWRQRLESNRRLKRAEVEHPDIFIGRVASADTVMKSGDHRDQLAKQYNIIAFEMEGAGLWDEMPCIVVKGICDYADSHKNKIWQPFAAATAAAVVKAMMARYTLADHHIQSSAPRNDESERFANPNGRSTTVFDPGQLCHVPPANLQVAHPSRRKPLFVSAPAMALPNGVQTLRDAIFDFQKVLTDDQRRELRRVMVVPDADAVLIFTAELDSINRNRKGRSLASRLHSVLQSVRDFSVAVEAFDSTYMGIAPMLWGSVKLTMVIAVKFVTYYDALSKCFMDLGAFCPRWTDYEVFYSHSPQLQDVLCGFYGSLLHCCKRATETIQRSWSTYLFNSSREAFEKDFQLEVEDIKRRSSYVKDAISLAKKEADYQNQQLLSKTTEEGSKREKTINFLYRKGSRIDEINSWQSQSDTRQAKERKQQLLDFLSTYDYLNPFKQGRRKRYSGTLEWLFQTQEFDRWINNSDVSLLWCSGKIGSGKTILTTSVIDKLLTEKRSSDIFISFFFIRFDDRESSNAEVILRSIIRQMLSLYDLSEEMEKMLEQMRRNLASGLKEILQLLQSMAAKFKTLYIVIDGLDECEKQDRHDLLEVLSSLISIRTNTKVFLAGRDSVSREVQRKFPSLKQIHIDCSLTESDIATYVEGIVEEKLKNEELIVGDPNLIKEIKMALSEGANGMFLWVAFQVDELSLQHCDDDIRNAIRNLPKDLEETFDRAIDRIVARGNANIAKHVFRLVAAAKEPLTLDQLKEVAFIEIGQKYSKSERQSNGIDHISSWCENLIHIDEELKTVQFPHQTVQQFFFEKSPGARHYQFYLELEDADHYLGEICVTYLNFNDFKTSLARRRQPLPPMPPMTMAKTALLPQWKAAASISLLWKHNLDIKGGSVAANAVESLASFQRDSVGEAKEKLHGGHSFLRYASLYWIFHTRAFQKNKSKTWNLWEKMILEGHDLATKPWDEDGKILEWSHKFHHHALARLSIHANLISISAKNRFLLNAATEGDINLLDIFLEVKDADLKMGEACLAAAEMGQFQIIERLFLAGVDGETAIQDAAKRGFLTAIESLVTAGVDGQVAIQNAAKNGFPDAIETLLLAGVDGQIAIRDAAIRNDQDLVKVLSTAVQSLLLAAAQRGDQAIIRNLLAAGLDEQAVIRDAAHCGNHEVIRSILAAGVDGLALLQAATERGDQEIIRNLLAAGVDGQSLLRVAAQRGDQSIIRNLLAAGVDGRVVLKVAAQRSRMLLAAGADMQSTIRATTRHDDQEVIRNLSAAGVDG